MYYSKNNCLVNLSNSILKAYGLNTYHESIPCIDKLLKDNDVPRKKLAVILLDGYGSYIQESVKDVSSYILDNKYTEITSVFPPTTVAATTAFLTGKFPCETGWLGWIQKLPMYNVPVRMFNSDFVDSGIVSPLKSYEFLPTTDLISLIDDYTLDYKANKLMSFLLKPLTSESFIKEANIMLNKNDFTYLYYVEPDGSLHDYGVNSPNIKPVIKEVNSIVKTLAEQNKDTLFIVIADHGHIYTKYLVLENYTDLYDMLEYKFNCLESRACMLYIKKDMIDKAGKLINKYFSKDDFDIYSKQEIIDNKIFGVGINNPHFEELLGDYLIVSKKDIGIADKFAEKLVSHHAGGTSFESRINVSVFNNKK